MIGETKNTKSKFVRSLIGSLILFVLVFQILLLTPKPAQALFGVGDITFTTTTSDIPRLIWDGVEKITKNVIAVSFKNALRTFTQQIAYDTAVKIASGGAGQKPLFTTKEFTKHITDAGNAAIGDALDTMSQEAWGFSLCDANLTTKIDMELSVGIDLGISKPRKAKCTGSDVLNNLTSQQLFEITPGLNIGIAGQDPAQISAALMKSFPDAFKPEGNNLGQYAKIHAEASEAEAKAKEKAKEEAEPPGEYLSLKSMITDETKTPAKTVESTQAFSLEQAINPDNTFTGELAADFIGVFTNTLIKKYLETLLTKGLNPNADTTGGNLTGFLTSGGIAAAEAKFASFTQPVIGGGGSVDILNKLSSCPTQYADVENCVMDSNFRTAAEQHLRVQEAIEKGYLDGNKPFGFGQGGSQLDYLNGYPYRSLVIMRRHRIIPVSWELAAQYVRDFGGGNYTLNQLISWYDDETSPFYQLIDPDWVLKAPDNYCRRQGYGEGLIFSEYFDYDGEDATPKVQQLQRKEVCVDDQSCVAENEDGTCRAYGYCIKEDPIWKFSGEQCPDYYASCKTYQSGAGQQSSYLEDTLDFNGCSADNFGCQWYCKEYDNTDEKWECYWDGDDYGYYGVYAPWGNTPQNGNQFKNWLAHLDAGAQTCDASAAGCHEFIRTTHGTNLISNANFDYYTGDPDDDTEDDINSWDPQNAAAPKIVTITTTSPYLGYNALKLPAGVPADDSVKYSHSSTRSVNGRTFTVSVYAKSDDSSSCVGNSIIKLSTTAGNDAVILPISNISDSWQRYELTNTINQDFNTIEVYLTVDSGCDVFWDAAYLEEKLLDEETAANDFIDYGAINKLYLTGERASCSDEDVGCQWYTPVAGGDAVPAKISSDDWCPAEKVGCKAYEETALTNIIPNPNNVNRTGKYCSGGIHQACSDDGDCDPLSGSYCYPSISLIASTGTQCSAAYAGCEEFTNLDEVAKGGEGKEYYTFLKQCVPEDDLNIKTYYAWEGDDVAGYQLRAFRLKESNLYPFPGETERAPCTHLNINSDPTQLFCTDSSNPADPTYVQECSSVYGSDPDCVEFFDASLHTFYRYKSQTITVSDDCHPERNSIDNEVYYGLPSESTSCPASATGCREYRGNAGYSNREILNDDFEDGSTKGWMFAIPSSESVFINGHSVKMYQPGVPFPPPPPVTLMEKTLMENTESLVSDQKTYILSFWAKSDSNNSQVIDLISMAVNFQGGPAYYPFADTDPATSAPSVEFPSDVWRPYTLGPVTIDTGGNEIADASIAFFGLNNHFYFDNIVLTEISDRAYLIRNSATKCWGEENCAAYRDIDNNIHNLKSFTKLCDEEAAGCEELIDTQNTSNPYSEGFGNPLETQSYMYTAVDNVVNLINNPGVYCNVADRGCRALGKPVITPDNSDPDLLDDLVEYETIYLKDDAEQYSTIWCNQSEVGCEKYSFSGGTGTAYFKDPGSKACEYKQQTGSLVYDWYKIGTEEECPTSIPPPSPPIPNDNWVGLCTDQYDGCTAYRDPMDPVACEPACPYEEDSNGTAVPFDSACTAGSGNPGCETYYYLANSVDKTSCNGQVDEQKGCKLFNDTDISDNYYTADLSPDGQESYCDISDPGYYGDLCATDSDCGSGTCVNPNSENGLPTNCYEGICVGGTNPGDACTATGGECQGGSCIVFIQNQSPYCDSNSIIKVERDRVCDEWLYCKTSLEIDDPNDVDGDGKTKEETCFEIGTCNELGDNGLCSGAIEKSPMNVTGDTPGYGFEEFQNLSGFVTAGLMYGCSNDHAISCTVATEDSDCGVDNHCEIIDGYFPYSQMYEVGMGGASIADFVKFGDFESDSINSFMVCNDEAENEKESCIINEHCIPKLDETVQPPVESNPECLDVEHTSRWQLIDSSLGSIVVTEGINLVGNVALDENNYLRFDPDNSPDVQGVKTRLSSNIINGQEYVASFDFKFEDPPDTGQDEITVSIAQFNYSYLCVGGDHNGDPCTLNGTECQGVVNGICTRSATPDISWEETLGQINGTTSWQQYTLDPYTIQSNPNENEETNLVFKNMIADYSFSMDNVSMKPVLAVQSANTNGLRGDYYDLIWQDVGNPGLNEECFDDTNLSNPGTCSNPYTVPRINWYSLCVYCQAGTTSWCDECDPSIPDPVDVIPTFMDNYNPDNGHLFVQTSSARWTGGIYFDESSDYVLFFNIDDGFRVWIDDMSVPVFEKWATIGPPSQGVPIQGFYVEKFFEAGWHPIKIEWNNVIDKGGPQMGWFKEPDSGWSNPPDFAPLGDCDGSPLGTWCAQYCNDPNSCLGSNHPKIPNDKLIPQSNLTTAVDKTFGAYHSTLFSDYLDYADLVPTIQAQAGSDEMVGARWTGQVLADTAGDYTFWFNADDGVKFYIDDMNMDRLANRCSGGSCWIDGDKEVSTEAINLSANWHNIKIEYYQNETDAKIQFGWETSTAGKVYPVPADHLSNESTPNYKARSCRAYPREDSQACHYIDDDLVEFNGWQGYCVESDPTNPNRCLTWWPIDAISGESTIFGTIDPAGYQGRTPLYMCAEANDIPPNPPWLDEPSYTTFKNNLKVATYPPTNNPTDIYVPRMVCIGRTENEGGENDACQLMAIVSDPKPLFYEKLYELAANLSEDWRIGRDPDLRNIESGGKQFNGNNMCEPNDNQCNNDCWNIIGTSSNRSDDNDGLDNVFCNVYGANCNGSSKNYFPSFNGAVCGDSNSCGGTDISDNLNDLREMWGMVVLYHWTNADYSGNWDRKKCNDDVGIQRYPRIDATYDFGAYPYHSTCTEPSNTRCDNPDNGDIFNGFYNLRSTTYALSLEPSNFDAPLTRVPRPQQCTVLVEGVAGTNEEKTFADRMSLTGGYVFDTSVHPEQYSYSKNCTPFGGTPVIDNPSNIELNSGIEIPLQLYHGSNFLTEDVCQTTVAGEGYYACGGGQPGVVDTDLCTTNWSGPESSDTEGFDRLRRLFADIYGAWTWDNINSQYVYLPSLVNTWNNEFDTMSLCPNSGAGPRPSYPGDYCAILPYLDNILVNNAAYSVTLGGGGNVNLTFNSYIDKEQQALKYITIDWGDGSTPTFVLWDGAPKSDPGNPHLFSHFYGYNNSPYSAQIEIMIEDNWGFCNNSSSNPPTGPNFRDCDITNFEYDFFGGIINVTP